MKKRDIEKGFFQVIQSCIHLETPHFYLAVSGGSDSMTMLHLFMKFRPNEFTVLHCNFGLRGEESDGDEQFIKIFCEQNEIPLFSKNFEIQSEGESIQMEARRLRYEWFSEFVKGSKNKFICTAHNKNDQAETIILNLIQGAFLRGISGIKQLENNLFRPMLTFEKQDIIDYCSQNDILFREDSSNSSNKYKRNFIRHNIIPLMQELNPNFINTIHTASTYRQSADDLIKNNYTKTYKILKVNKSIHYFELPTIRKNNNLALLNELLIKYGFNFRQAQTLYAQLILGKSCTLESNKYNLFYSTNQKSFLISPINIEFSFTKYILNQTSNDYKLWKWKKDSIIAYYYGNEEKPSHDTNDKNLSKHRFEIPIQSNVIVRSFMEGDKISLSENLTKMLSDIFRELKYSEIKRKCIPLLEIDGEIAYIFEADIQYQYFLNYKHKDAGESKKILNIELSTVPFP